MKIIAVDNFAREHVSDVLIANNLTQEEAEKMLQEPCYHNHANHPSYFRIVEDDYELYVFTP